MYHIYINYLLKQYKKNIYFKKENKFILKYCKK